MLKGSIVALVTPFDKKGFVDEKKLRFLVDWHIKNKTDAILVCGTTGESATLTHQEHRTVIDIAIDQARCRVPIIAGCGSNSTSEALELAEFSHQRGADYALVITPYYNKPTQTGLYKHFRTIADKVKIPIIIYNVPSRTGINILPSTVVSLYKDCKNIIGIKEASGSLDQMEKIMTLVDDKFRLFSGDDGLTVPILSIGGVGVISVVANIMPKQTHDMVESFLNKDFQKAKKIQLYMYDLIKVMFIETNPIPVKTALSMMGFIEDNFRLPLCGMEKDNKNLLTLTLKKYKLIK